MPITEHYPQGADSINLERFFDEQHVALERFLALRVSSFEDARDLASEIVCQFLEYVRREERAIRNPRALLYKIARNRLADYYGAKREHYREVPIEDAPPIATDTTIPAAIDARGELERTLHAMAALSDEQRELLILHANVGLEIGELAEMMEVSTTVIRVRLHRARRALKRELALPEQAV